MKYGSAKSNTASASFYQIKYSRDIGRNIGQM